MTKYAKLPNIIDSLGEVRLFSRHYNEAICLSLCRCYHYDFKLKVLYSLNDSLNNIEETRLLAICLKYIHENECHWNEKKTYLRRVYCKIHNPSSESPPTLIL